MSTESPKTLLYRVGSALLALASAAVLTGIYRATGDLTLVTVIAGVVIVVVLLLIALRAVRAHRRSRHEAQGPSALNQGEPPRRG